MYIPYPRLWIATHVFAKLWWLTGITISVYILYNYNETYFFPYWAYVAFLGGFLFALYCSFKAFFGTIVRAINVAEKTSLLATSKSLFVKINGEYHEV